MSTRLVDRITKGPITWMKYHANATIRGAEGQLIAVTECGANEHADADLIAETFRVAHEHGLSPAELVAQRDELAGLLRAMLSTSGRINSALLRVKAREILANLDPI